MWWETTGQLWIDSGAYKPKARLGRLLILSIIMTLVATCTKYLIGSNALWKAAVSSLSADWVADIFRG